MKKTTFFLASCILFVMPFFAFGQEGVDLNTSEEYVHQGEMTIEEIDAIMSQNESEVPDFGNADCFDYYEFYSVETSISPNGDMWTAGAPVEFSGYILNKNTYPVVDGSLYVRISHVNDENMSQGNDIVDEFYAIEGISLDVNEQKSVNFVWQTSENFPAGNYQADLFFVVGNKFNLAGLSFTNEIVGAVVQFTLTSSAAQTVYFDRASTKVNGQEYAHIGSLPSVENGGEASILQNIINRSASQVDVEVTYDLYYWDSLDESSKINSTKEIVGVDAISQKEILYTVPRTDQSVYYLQITARSGDQKSIINIRFTGSGDRVRLNYPGITKFPIQEGDNVNLFTCFHNTAYTNARGKIVAELFDREGMHIASAEYEGIIPSAMSAQVQNFVSQKDYDYVKLVSRAYDERGEMVDQYEAVYDCAQFNTCQKQSIDLKKYGTWLYIASGILFVGVVIFVSIGSLRNRNN